MRTQSDVNEESSEEISRDLAAKERQYPSDITPQEFYGYKKFRSDPDAKSDFRGTVDKDVVFANIGGNKPGMEELNFRHGTSLLFKNIFLDQAEDQEEYDAFRPVFDYLLGEYKFQIVASRAQGADREAVLDNITSIKKEVSRKKEEGAGFGFGK